MGTYSYNAPAFGGVGAREVGWEMPDEGQIFKTDTDFVPSLNVVKGGVVQTLTPETYYRDTKFGGDTNAFYKWANQQGLTTARAVTDRIWKELGISTKDIPYYNPANITAVARKGGLRMDKDPRSGGAYATTQLSFSDLQNALGNLKTFTAPTGTMIDRPLSAAEAPKLVSGAQGPVDAQGNPIKPEDYAKYGITGGATTGGQTPATGAPGASGATPSGLPPIQDPATGKYYENLGGGKIGGEVSAPSEGGYTGQTITDPATGQIYQSSGANVGQPIGQTPTGEAVETPTAGELDMTDWTEAQIDAYYKYKDLVDYNAQQGKIINPDIEINADILKRFQEQAKTELGPYYTQIFNQANQDMERASKQLAESYGSQERTLGEQYGKALEGTQESYARRGLSDSTMRTGAERELATQATRSLEDLQKGTEQAAQSIGIAGERQVGTANMPSLGSYNVGAKPVLGQAGVYGMTPSSQSRSLYTPTGGTTGTYEQERLTAEEQRKRSLIGAEREYRATAYL